VIDYNKCLSEDQISKVGWIKGKPTVYQIDRTSLKQGLWEGKWVWAFFVVLFLAFMIAMLKFIMYYLIELGVIINLTIFIVNTIKLFVFYSMNDWLYASLGLLHIISLFFGDTRSTKMKDDDGDMDIEPFLGNSKNPVISFFRNKIIQMMILTFIPVTLLFLLK
jgi:hypothetical protein